MLDRRANHQVETGSAPASELALHEAIAHPPFDVSWRRGCSPQRTPTVGGVAKRMVDLALAIFLLPVAAIVGLAVAIAVLSDGGNPIFAHARIGRHGRTFRCYKFRTMVRDSEARLAAILREDADAHCQWQHQFKLENDPRVTPIGRFLRKSGLDEIPQLWNILCGDMSWVGPRPVTRAELVKYGLSLPAYLSCRPGLTGLWQIHRTRDTSYAERVAYDVRYGEEWSIGRDFLILIRTPFYLAVGKGLC